MSQEHTPEETHNSREIEEKAEHIARDFCRNTPRIKKESGVEFYERLNATVFNLLTTNHQELQKARRDWLREEIVKLEGIVSTEYPIYGENPFPYKHFVVRSIDIRTIIDRYQSELDQPNK